MTQLFLSLVDLCQALEKATISLNASLVHTLLNDEKILDHAVQVYLLKLRNEAIHQRRLDILKIFCETPQLIGWMNKNHGNFFSPEFQKTYLLKTETILNHEAVQNHPLFTAIHFGDFENYCQILTENPSIIWSLIIEISVLHLLIIGLISPCVEILDDIILKTDGWNIKCNTTGDRILHLALKLNSPHLRHLLKFEKSILALLSHNHLMKKPFELSELLPVSINYYYIRDAMVEHGLLKTDLTKTGFMPYSRNFIDQLHLNKNIRAFLDMKQNDEKELFHLKRQLNGKKRKHYPMKTDVLNPEGCCAGWSFLYILYSVLGKQHQFFSILRFISSWDAKSTSFKQLQLPGILQGSAEDYLDTGLYKDPFDLFTQTANDLMWFQSGCLDILKNKHYSLAIDLYKVVTNQAELESIGFSDRHVRLFNTKSHEQLVSIFKLFQHQRGLGIKINFLTKISCEPNLKTIQWTGHAVSVYISETGQFQYYDPNFNEAEHPFQTAEDFVYYMTHSSQIPTLSGGSYCFNFETIRKTHSNLNENPSNQYLSIPLDPIPCLGWDILHLAIFTGNPETIKKALLTDISSFFHLDAFDTPAFAYNIQLILKVLLDGDYRELATQLFYCIKALEEKNCVLFEAELVKLHSYFKGYTEKNSSPEVTLNTLKNIIETYVFGTRNIFSGFYLSKTVIEPFLPLTLSYMPRFKDVVTNTPEAKTTSTATHELKSSNLQIRCKL